MYPLAWRCRALMRSPRQRVWATGGPAEPAQRVQKHRRGVLRKCSGTSTGSCRPSTSTAGCWPWPRTRISRCSNGSSSWPSSAPTSTSSSRCGWPGSRTRRRPVSGTAPDGLSVADQLRAIRAEVEVLFERRRVAFLDEVLPALAEQGVRLRGMGFARRATTAPGSRRCSTSGSFRCSPRWPWIPGIPFPTSPTCRSTWPSSSATRSGGERRFARVKVPPLLPGLLAMPDGERFVALEQVIAAHLDALFPGMEIESHHPFRVTRNADLTLEEEEADDLLEAVEMELRRRRFGRAVRLEVDASITEEVRDPSDPGARPRPEDVYDVDGPARPDRPVGWCTTWTGRSSRTSRSSRSPRPAWSSADGETDRRLRGHPPGRHPGPPPLRELRRLRRGVHHPGVAGSPASSPSSRPCTARRATAPSCGR